MTRKLDRYGRPFTDDPKVAALQAEWYRRLADTGFVDIEPPPDNIKRNSYLRDHWIETKKRVVRGVETGKAELFRLAFAWLDVPVWKTRTERWAFAAWTSGFDFREIAARWPSLGGHGAFASRVRTQTKHFLAYFRAENVEEPSDL